MMITAAPPDESDVQTYTTDTPSNARRLTSSELHERPLLIYNVSGCSVQLGKLAATLHTKDGNAAEGPTVCAYHGDEPARQTALSLLLAA